VSILTMILNILTSIVKYFMLGLIMFSMSVLFITIGAMTYGGIVESLKTSQTQSQ
jgi:hypothetical protein